ncbi:MAG: hypothetical protein JSS00_04750, partial [Proteobacteria bacterium]|nr:hypothetical protein [Pseudomonadota bacterium]
MVDAVATPRIGLARNGVMRGLAVFGLLAAFVAAWTLYGAITGLASAVHHDTAEAYIWGREFQLG